jgi:hypothetical protein
MSAFRSGPLLNAEDNHCMVFGARYLSHKALLGRMTRPLKFDVEKNARTQTQASLRQQNKLLQLETQYDEKRALLIQDFYLQPLTY